MARVRVLPLLALLIWATPIGAQELIRLQSTRVSDTLSSSGDSVVLTNALVGGFGSVKVQTLDSYTGTWEVQCSVDGTTAGFNTGTELKLTLADDTTVVYSVSDTVAIWDVGNAAACGAIRVMATAGFSGTDTVVVISATQSGGSSGGGAGGGGDASSSNQDEQTVLLTTIDTSTADAAGSLNNIEDDIDFLRQSIYAVSDVDEVAKTKGDQGICYAQDFDAGALPGVVTAEGDAVRTACSLYGVGYVMLVSENGSTDVGAALMAPIFTDEAAFTYATSKVVAAGFVAESTTDALADNTVGAASMTLTRSVRVTPTGYLGGGGSPVTMKSDNTNNDDLTAICTGPCTVYSITAFNHAATSAFLRCENDTTGNTTPGSESNAAGEPDFEIPGNTAGAGFTVSFPVGVSFSTALSCWIATGEAATDATDAATDDVSVLFSRVQ